jgi:hypothetical protein
LLGSRSGGMPGSAALSAAPVALWLRPAVAATLKLPDAPAVACAFVSAGGGGAEHAHRAAIAAAAAEIPTILDLRLNIALLKQAAHTTRSRDAGARGEGEDHHFADC